MNLFFDLIHIMNRKYYTSTNEFIISPEVDHEIANIVFVPNAILIFKKDVNFGTIGRTNGASIRANEDLKKYVQHAREKLKDFLP